MSHSAEARYSEIDVVGDGCFGHVIRARNKLTGEIVAVKRIERGPRIDKYTMNQILNHRLLNHPHIIKFKECFLTKEHLCIVMEYASGGNLKNFITCRGGIGQNTARWFFQQLIIGLDYCHKRGVIHRDIKLQNVVVESKDEYPLLKICDFTLSKHEILNSSPQSVIGTVYYMAPEIIVSERAESYDGQKVDIWSCGVLLYAMVFNCFPFIKKEDISSINSFVKIAQRILTSPLEFPSNDMSSKDVRDLLTKILEKDPDQRITLHQIMEHKWFRTYLPDDVLEINKDLNQLDRGLQSEDEIRCIIEAAKSPNRSDDEKVVVLPASVSDDSDSL